MGSKTVKKSGSSATDNRRLTQHGSKHEREVARRSGIAAKWTTQSRIDPLEKRRP